jgi:predicted NBD/HSP70 family sugar kinase
MVKSLRNLTAGSRLLLDLLWRHGPLPRARLAEMTGFTRASITNIADELLDRDLLTEQEAEKGRRGQPARPLALRGNAAHAIGISFSTSYGEVGAIDFAGKLVGTARFAIAEPTPEAIAEAVAPAIADLAASHQLPSARLLGVGVAIPADFAPDGTALPHALFPALRGPGLADRFSAGLNLPVLVENDGRAWAIGERLMGIGSSWSTFMLVHIGHGVGGGLIIDGKPYYGAWGNAGILGQYYPYGQPRPSGLDLVETLCNAGIDVRDFDWFDTPSVASESVIHGWTKRVAEQLGGDLARISRFFGPEAVILAGRVPPEVLEGIAAAIDLRRALGSGDDLPVPVLRASSLGAAAGVIGAAAVPVLDVLLPARSR